MLFINRILLLRNIGLNNCIKRSFVVDVDPILKQKKHYGVEQKVYFLSNVLALDSNKTMQFLSKNLSFQRVSLDDIGDTFEFLVQRNFNKNVIRENPTILLASKLTLQNRMKIFEECCFNELQLSYLVKYVSLLNKKVTVLKAYNYIDINKNVVGHLKDCLNMTEIIKGISEDNALVDIRMVILKCFLMNHLDCQGHVVDKLLTTYPRIKHKSFEHITGILKLLKNSLGFDSNRIVRNGYLIHANPDNVRNMLTNIPEIGGQPINEILFKRPKIMMSNWDTVEKIIKHIRNFDIPETAITKCVDVLTLGADTVYERLNDLKKIDEFSVLCTHPRILRLVHYRNKALTRLNYLQQLKVKCVSLHVLAGSSNSFEKYAREGVDKTKGKDIVHYLSKVFKANSDEVRRNLSRHPNWCHIPLLSVKASLDFLRYKKFNLDEIYKNIHILLYPIPRIDAKLNDLKDWMSETNLLKMHGSTITNEKLLKLCLYFIEAEFHFTGDGVWMESQQHDHVSANIPTLPKTLSRTYKYGLRPSKLENTDVTYKLTV